MNLPNLTFPVSFQSYQSCPRQFVCGRPNTSGVYTEEEAFYTTEKEVAKTLCGPLTDIFKIENSAK